MSGAGVNLRSSRAELEPASAAVPLLEAEGIRKSYRDGGWRRRDVLVDISFSIHPGEVVGLTGENGSGKSTLLRILTGLIRPDAGRVARPARFGYCPQEYSLFDELTPEETFQYFGTAYGMSRGEIDAATRHWLEALDFAACRRTRLAYLSEGTKQKLNVSLAAMHRPPLLLLDEPYAGLDERTYQAFWRLIGEIVSRGHSCLIVTHLTREHSCFNRMIRLANGRNVGDA